MYRITIAICAVAVATACSSSPRPEAAPAPAVQPSAPPTTLMMVPAAAIGTWRLQVDIQSGNRPPQRTRRDPQASMTLTSLHADAMFAGGPSSQYGATITVPGYSRPARRGRAGQAASWWPIAGDSIVVQFTQGQQSRGDIQLRGALHGTSLRGEVWYSAGETGSVFQLGVFSGTKTRT